MLKGNSRLASSHLEIYVSLFQHATVVSNNFIKLPYFSIRILVAILQLSSIIAICWHFLKQLLRVETRIRISQNTPRQIHDSPVLVVDEQKNQDSRSLYLCVGASVAYNNVVFCLLCFMTGLSPDCVVPAAPV